MLPRKVQSNPNPKTKTKTKPKPKPKPKPNPNPDPDLNPSSYLCCLGKFNPNLTLTLPLTMTLPLLQPCSKANLKGASAILIIKLNLGI